MDEIKLYENKQIRSVWDDEKEIKRRRKRKRQTVRCI